MDNGEVASTTEERGLNVQNEDGFLTSKIECCGGVAEGGREEETKRNFPAENAPKKKEGLGCV